jgi:hypothetical protein
LNKDFKNNKINIKDEDSMPPLKPHHIDENDNSDNEEENEQDESDDDIFEAKREDKIDLNLRSKNRWNKMWMY